MSVKTFYTFLIKCVDVLINMLYNINCKVVKNKKEWKNKMKTMVKCVTCEGIGIDWRNGEKCKPCKGDGYIKRNTMEAILKSEMGNRYAPWMLTEADMYVSKGIRQDVAIKTIVDKAKRGDF